MTTKALGSRDRRLSWISESGPGSPARRPSDSECRQQKQPSRFRIPKGEKTRRCSSAQLLRLSEARGRRAGNSAGNPARISAACPRLGGLFTVVIANDGLFVVIAKKPTDPCDAAAAAAGSIGIRDGE